MPAISIRRPALAFLTCALLLLCTAAPAAARIGLSQHRLVERGMAASNGTATHPTPHGKKKQAPSAPDPGTLFEGTTLNQFWLAQSAAGAITETPNPDGEGNSVFKMTVANQDVYPITPTENPRAELLSPPTIEPGDEIWWSAEFFLPAEEFPASTPNFVTLLEGPYGKPFAGTPPFHIEVNGDQIKWQRNGTYDYDVPWQMNIVRNRWIHVMVHEKFAEEGFVELWIDGKPMTFFEHSEFNPDEVAPTTRLPMATVDSSNDEGPGSIYLQSYRKAGMFQSLTVLQGPLAIGETRASVED
jgi:hypothetical protein